MTSSPMALDFRSALKSFFFFAIFVAILVWAGTYFTKVRADNLYSQYANETNAWAVKNREGLKKIFALFPNAPCGAYYTPVPQASGSGYLTQCPTQDEIAQAVSHDIKDWSSTEFIKLNGNRILLMRLSGSVEEFNPYSGTKNESLVKLLDGEIPSVPLDYYTYSFGTKEAVIPVKDDSGKIIGAVIRGVIEPSKFSR